MRRPSRIRCVENASFVVFVLMAVWHVWGLEVRLGWAAVAAVVAGYVAADLVSGLVHWFSDTYFRETTPVIGRMLIHPFREHHRDPSGITRHGMVELTGNSALALAPVMAWGPPDSGVAGVWVLSFAFSLMATNVIHKWAHQERVSRAVAALQRARLILPPEHHARHHAGDHRAAYCITTGWCNWLLDHVLRRG